MGSTRSAAIGALVRLVAKSLVGPLPARITAHGIVAGAVELAGLLILLIYTSMAAARGDPEYLGHGSMWAGLALLLAYLVGVWRSPFTTWLVACTFAGFAVWALMVGDVVLTALFGLGAVLGGWAVRSGLRERRMRTDAGERVEAYRHRFWAELRVNRRAVAGLVLLSGGASLILFFRVAS